MKVYGTDDLKPNNILMVESPADHPISYRFVGNRWMTHTHINQWIG